MTQRNGNAYNFKVVLLGEGKYSFSSGKKLKMLEIYKKKHVNCSFIGAVGKTSIVLRYVEDTFNTNHITTLQVRENLST